MKLLFLGDSITDAYHSFDPENLGEGYVRMIYEALSQTIPQLQIINKGIDGFTVPRVYEMWQDTPHKASYDTVTVLVGVNDVGMWMDCGHSRQWIEKAEKEFVQTYEDLITDLCDHNISQIILMEPFIFPCPAKYSLWQPYLQNLSLEIQRLAQGYQITFLPLQELLSSATKTQGYPAITPDGIHLTQKGNRLLADAWLKKMHEIKH